MNGVPTFALEDQLPRVPVPTLERSAELFLEWCRPLLSEQERHQTEHAVDELLVPGGDGERLHEALASYEKEPGVASWLDEFWRDRYLGRRDRIALNANFFFLLNDTGEDQATRAAGLVVAALAVKIGLDTGRFPPATHRGTPLSMDQFKYLFSATRIPGAERDTARTPYATGWPGPSLERHIAVLHRGSLFRLDVVGPHGVPHPAAEIHEALQAVLDRPDDGAGPGLGRLTTLARAEWATTRETLREGNPTNAAALEEIETALFCLCLDDDEPADAHAAGDILLHGNAANRWYDKGVSFIVFRNGVAGLSGEHCRLDGTTVVGMVDAMAEVSTDVHEQRCGAREQGPPRPHEIPIDLDDDLATTVAAAGDAFTDYAGEVATTTLTLDVGADDIKAAGASPDAFAQMAIQVAHQRTKGHVGATYESVATRTFRHGRTEAMRVVTPDSIRLVELMDAEDATDDERRDALRTAIERHVARARQCQAGDAPEQHLWELQLIQRRHGPALGVEDQPAVYDSPGWAILRDDYLSTSAVPSAHVQFFGFGATGQQCIGIGYALHADRLAAYLCTGRRAADQLGAFVDALRTAVPELLALLRR